MSWLSGQVLAKDHSGKKNWKKKVIFQNLLAQVAEAGSWQCIQGCSHPQLLAAAPVKPQPHCKTHLLRNRKEWGLLLYQPCFFLTWKSTKLVLESWKRDCVIMKMMVVPAPSIQKSWVGLAEVIKSLKIRKVVFLSILAAVLTFSAYEILNAHLLRLFRGMRLVQPQTKIYILLRKYNQPFLGGSLSTQHIWHLCTRKLNLTLIT